MKNSTDLKKLKQQIATRAKQLGFSFIGFARANQLDHCKNRLNAWLENGYHAEMQYMENHADKRIDIAKLFPGAKTVISFAHSYFPAKEQDPETLKIAKYAYGQDYHHVLKKKLANILNMITDNGYGSGRIFTDSAPILEREWARRAGIGWIGKHSLLITPKHGSFFFLSEIITDAEFPYDAPFDKNYCGTCTRCIDACPTNAIIAPGIIDSNKCLSYWTIEHKGEFGTNTPEKFSDRIFGCDICQDVCPWNKKSIVHNENSFAPHPDLLSLKKEDWKKLSIDHFNILFKKSPVKRTKFSGLTRNIKKANG